MAGRALVVTVSTRAAAGVYADRSGPAVVDELAAAGWQVGPAVVVPDGDAVEAALRSAVGEGYDVVLTSGGTGLGPDDQTPEATLRVVDRLAPGLAEVVRASGLEAGVATAALSRGVAGAAGRTLVVNLPGSVGGARDGIRALLPVLGHAVDQLRGGDHR
jgi:molybdenum cofactor synthesis domain-containing protein